jgi:hypothetical protein
MMNNELACGRVSIDEGANQVGQPWATDIGSVACVTGNDCHHHLTKSGHAFYVVAVNNLFVRGVPSRFNYSQSAAGLP